MDDREWEPRRGAPKAVRTARSGARMPRGRRVLPIPSPRVARHALLALAALAAIAGLSLIAARPAFAQPTPAAPIVIDGPSAGLSGPLDLGSAIARDGTGGLVYLKQVGGVAHVFASLLSGGTFAAPVQLDSGLAGASSQPVIAADSGGALIVAFVNGPELYVSQRAGAATAMSAPRPLAAGASNPSLEMTPFGKAYLAFAVGGPGTSNVRAAYYYAGSWSVEAAPLNATPNDGAGSGSGRPAVGAAGDGVGIVAWGEGGHIFSRRVWGTAPSVVFEQADGGLGGCGELGADEPAIGTGGDSSYAAVAFHETLSCGGQTQSRVLYNRLHGSRYDGVGPGDGLGTPGVGGADDPQVAVNEYGRGWVTSERTGSLAAIGLWLGSSEWPNGPTQVNSQTGNTAPSPVPAIAGYLSTLIAWQQDPGSTGPAEIRARYASSGGTLGPELVLSAPAQGSTDAAQGLTAGGNVAGEAAVAWVQDTPAGEELVADQLYQPPGGAQPTGPGGYVHSTLPTLTWAASSEPWGPVRYSVSLDGAPIAQTTSLSAVAPTPVRQGPHAWSVSASNPAALTSATHGGRFFVDTLAPRVTLKLAGRRRAGALLHLHLIDSDAPPGLPPADGSGVALAFVRWGDHTSSVLRHWRFHAYRRPGRYRVTVIVADRAGNVATVTLVIRIQAKPKPKKHRATGKPKTGAPAGSGSGGATPGH